MQAKLKALFKMMAAYDKPYAYHVLLFEALCKEVAHLNIRNFYYENVLLLNIRSSGELNFLEFDGTHVEISNWLAQNHYNPEKMIFILVCENEDLFRQVNSQMVTLLGEVKNYYQMGVTLAAFKTPHFWETSQAKKIRQILTTHPQHLNTIQGL